MVLTTLVVRWPVMSWNEHASKMISILSATSALKAVESRLSADMTASAHSMMVLVAASVALHTALSSWPAAGMREDLISLALSTPISRLSDSM